MNSEYFKCELQINWKQNWINDAFLIEKNQKNQTIGLIDTTLFENTESCLIGIQFVTFDPIVYNLI